MPFLWANLVDRGRDPFVSAKNRDLWAKLEGRLLSLRMLRNCYRTKTQAHNLTETRFLLRSSLTEIARALRTRLVVSRRIMRSEEEIVLRSGLSHLQISKVDDKGNYTNSSNNGDNSQTHQSFPQRPVQRHNARRIIHARVTTRLALAALKGIWVRVITVTRVSGCSLDDRSVEIFVLSCDVGKVVPRLTDTSVWTSSKPESTDKFALQR